MHVGMFFPAFRSISLVEVAANCLMAGRGGQAVLHQQGRQEQEHPSSREELLQLKEALEKFGEQLREAGGLRNEEVRWWVVPAGERCGVGGWRDALDSDRLWCLAWEDIGWRVLVGCIKEESLPAGPSLAPAASTSSCGASCL